MKKKLLLSLAMIAMVMGLQAKTVKTSFKVNGACDEMCKPRITKAARGVRLFTTATKPALPRLRRPLQLRDMMLVM